MLNIGPHRLPLYEQNHRDHISQNIFNKNVLNNMMVSKCLNWHFGVNCPFKVVSPQFHLNCFRGQCVSTHHMICRESLVGGAYRWLRWGFVHDLFIHQLPSGSCHVSCGLQLALWTWQWDLKARYVHDASIPRTSTCWCGYRMTLTRPDLRLLNIQMCHLSHVMTHLTHTWL